MEAIKFGVIPTHKVCKTCKKDKPLEAFHKDFKLKDGKATSCKECRGKIEANRYKRNPDRSRNGMLKRLYSLSEEEYQKMFTAQQGLCASCGQPENSIRYGKVDRLAIDHCHTTGAVRGLLCSKCNRALGLLHEDPDKIRGLLKYVEEKVLY